jgi:D-aminoacyl-tRNA deacylase
MRAVIQRVKSAAVSVNDHITGEIAAGLLIFVGIEDADTEEDIEWLCNKLINLRIFNDAAGVKKVTGPLTSELPGRILPFPYTKDYWSGLPNLPVR